MNRDPKPKLLFPSGTLIKETYTIVGHLGEGGFGQVFEGRQNMIDRPVAIKVLSLIDDETAHKRFLQEAQAAARIEHPGVVHIYDFGIHEQHPFMVMEMLRGHDLADQLNHHGTMSRERLVPLFIDVLEALAEAHKLGIVHKDLKPSNLFLSHPGEKSERIKILDFGIARVLDANMPADSRGVPMTPEGKPMTATGQSIGTPQYIAPEYIQEQLVSPALDVYQMGLILVEMLSGKPVVEGHTWWTCALKHIEGQLDIPTDLLEGDLGACIRKATATDPQQRFVDAMAFADALSALLNKAPSTPPPKPSPSPSEPAVPPRPAPKALSQPPEPIPAPPPRSTRNTDARALWLGIGLAVGGGLILCIFVAGIFFVITQGSEENPTKASTNKVRSAHAAEQPDKPAIVDQTQERRRARDTLDNWLRRWNRGDFDGMATLMTPDFKLNNRWASSTGVEPKGTWLTRKKRRKYTSIDVRMLDQPTLTEEAGVLRFKFRLYVCLRRSGGKLYSSIGHEEISLRKNTAGQWQIFGESFVGIKRDTDRCLQPH